MARYCCRMAIGDHIYVKRLLYTHHGVQVSDEMVVHFSGTPGNKRGATIRRDTLDAFANGGEILVRAYGGKLARAEIVERAEAKVGQDGYNLFANNCEHFACWCVTGYHRSAQVVAVNGTAGVGAATAVAAGGGVGIISTAGVAGVSGAGIMSGLAAVGGVVGSGAVGGLALLGVAPSAVSALIMHRTLGDSDSLPPDERSARRVGRTASVVGAAGGTAAGVAAVSSAGVVAGLSGAGISSGLAAIGAGVGGGMLAGSAIVVAAPAVAAAGLSYGAYRVARRLRRRVPKPAADEGDAVLGSPAPADFIRVGTGQQGVEVVTANRGMHEGSVIRSVTAEDVRPVDEQG